MKISLKTIAAVAALGVGSFAFAFTALHHGQRPAPISKLRPDQAIHLAVEKTGGEAIQATFEFEDGKWQYAVLVVKNHKLMEVELNAMNGKIGDVETADPAGEAKEFESDLKAAMSGKTTAAAAADSGD